jgi:hypothetical protein
MIDIVYYAHDLSLYNTDQEQMELALLDWWFSKALIFNPNRPDVQLAENPMEVCLDIVKDESITKLVFSSILPNPYLTNDYVHSGVRSEVITAQKRKIPVFFLRRETIMAKRIIPFRGDFEHIEHSKPPTWRIKT